MKKLLLLALLAIPLSLMAETSSNRNDSELRLSRSAEHLARPSTTPEAIDELLENAEKSVQLPLSTSIRTQSRALSAAAHGSIWVNVYDTEVSTDRDLDGYYQRFTLSFQPETTSSFEDIYADIYLSYEGRTWDYLTSTAHHRIYGSDVNDVIHLTTVLDYGYPAGYYDVLIEIRDAHTDQLLTSVGPDTEGALALLPLEDDHHDSYYYDHGTGVSVGYSIHGSGSFGFASLLVGGGILGLRRMIRTIQF